MQVLTRRTRPGEAAVVPAPTWRVLLSTALSLLGLALSAYLTAAHYAGAHILECTANSVVNCERVTTSAQSHVFGIPVAVLGLAYFVVMTAINSPWAWRASDRRIHVARLVLAVVGMGFVLYLIWAELLVIKAICLYCTAVHVVTFAQLILVVATVPTMLGWGRDDSTPERPGRR